MFDSRPSRDLSITPPTSEAMPPPTPSTAPPSARPGPAMFQPSRRSGGLHVAGVLAAVGYGFLAWGSHHLGNPTLLFTLLSVLALGWLTVLGVSRQVLRNPQSFSLPVVLSYGLLFRFIGFLAEPVLEEDYYRFLWDGRTFAERGSPYGVAPAASFEATDLDERSQEILNHIAFPQIPTVYGPTLEAAFLLSHTMAPGELWPLKALLIGSELLAWLLLRRFLDPAACTLWLWCPLLIQETAFSAHPDALGLAGLAAAILARHHHRSGIAGVFLAIAVGARPFAALFLPFLAHGFWRRTLGGFLPTLALCHVPFLWGNASALEGWTTFASDWEFNSSGFALLQAALGTTYAKATAALVFLVVFGVITRRWLSSHTPSAANLPPGDSILGTLLLLSPVANPWYAQWLLPFVAARRHAWSLAFVALISLSYVTEGNLGRENVASFDHPAWLRPIEFGLVLAVALAGAGLSRFRRRNPPPGSPIHTFPRHPRG